MNIITNIPLGIIKKGIKFRWRISLWLKLLRIDNNTISPFKTQLNIPFKNTVDPQLGKTSIKGLITIDGVRQKYPLIKELVSPHLLSPNRRYWLRKYNSFSWLDDCAVLKGDVFAQKTIGKQMVQWLQASQTGKRKDYFLNFYATMVGTLHQNWDIDCLIERQCQWLRHGEYLHQCILCQSDAKKWLQLWWNIIKIQSSLIHIIREDNLKWRLWDIDASLILENTLRKFCLSVYKKLTPKNENKALRIFLKNSFQDDGLLLSGNPQQLLRVLFIFNDIKRIYEANNASCPELIISTLNHGVQVIRQLRHGDGALTVLHGGQEDDSILIDKLIKSLAIRSKKINKLTIRRLSLGSSVVIMDCTSPTQYGLKCASSLAIEFSDGPHRIVVNCGIPSFYKQSRERNLFCNTAAHSSVVINNTNSSFINSDNKKSNKGINIRITPESKQTEQKNLIEASHNGYIERFDCGHVRCLQLINKGSVFIGKDCLTSKQALEFNLRFHLHPSVVAALTNKSRTAIIKCSPKRVWKFSCSNKSLSLENSVYWGNGEGQKTQNIVISGICNIGETWLVWEWKRFL